MPQVNLTTRFLDALRPASTRVEYVDTGSRGLILRLTADGLKTWTLRYRTPRGERRRLTLGQYPDLSLQQARKRAAVERGQVANGQDPSLDKQVARQATTRPTETIAALVEAYIAKHAKIHKRSWRDDDRMFNAEVLPAWKDRLVKDLTRRDVRALVDAIADRGSPITANRCLALIRGMLNFAIREEWDAVDANVASLIKKPGVERSRDRVLTDEEIRLVWAACAVERRALCALLRLRLVTAQRGGELAALKWTDVAGDWMTIPEHVTKNKQPHRVPLTATAIEILDGLPRIEGCPWIFPGQTDTKPLGDAKKGGRRVGQRVLAALQKVDPSVAAFDFRGHDLRRTASTYMAEAGVSPADIARVLNHAEGGPRATQIYNRYTYDREKRIALETWERRLLAILDNRVVPAVAPFARTAS